MQGTGADRGCPPLRGAVCRFGDGTTGSLAQPPKTKEPYGCDIPLAGACPTVCRLPAVGIDRAGGSLRRKKRDGTLLLYASAISTPYRSLCHPFQGASFNASDFGASWSSTEYVTALLSRTRRELTENTDRYHWSDRRQT